MNSGPLTLASTVPNVFISLFWDHQLWVKRREAYWDCKSPSQWHFFLDGRLLEHYPSISHVFLPAPSPAVLTPALYILITCISYPLVFEFPENDHSPSQGLARCLPWSMSSHQYLWNEWTLGRNCHPMAPTATQQVKQKTSWNIFRS